MVNENVVCLTGITGQVGSYLTELLLEKGYTVHGLKRSASTLNTERIDHIFNHPNLKLHYGDLGDYNSIVEFVGDLKPAILFGCGALSHVRISYDIPEYCYNITGAGTLRCLEAIRKYSPKTKFVNCATSELFGGVSKEPLNENSPFVCRSPYAVAKLTSIETVRLYKAAYGLFCTSAISFNHTSPRRGINFFEKKIIAGLVRCKLGLQNEIFVGNLNSYRDFSHASDIANGLWLIANHKEPEEFVLASGTTISMRDLTQMVADKLNIDWTQYVKYSDALLRPAEVDHLLGDSTKARKVLGWQPKYDLNSIVEEMINFELQLLNDVC